MDVLKSPCCQRGAPTLLEQELVAGDGDTDAARLPRAVSWEPGETGTGFLLSMSPDS